MLKISCLKGDSDQTKFRFGISVKNCIRCDNFRKNPRNFIFHRKIYRKSGCFLLKIRKFWANSAHLQTWPRYWCDNAVWKIWGLWGHYFWSYRVNGRPDILTDFRVYSFFFLSTQKRNFYRNWEILDPLISVRDAEMKMTCIAETVTGHSFLSCPVLPPCPATQLALLSPVRSCAVKKFITLPCTAVQDRMSCRTDIVSLLSDFMLKKSYLGEPFWCRVVGVSSVSYANNFL